MFGLTISRPMGKSRGSAEQGQPNKMEEKQSFMYWKEGKIKINNISQFQLTKLHKSNTLQ